MALESHDNKLNDFHKLENYTIDDIQALIDCHAEEGVHLEFKRADALSQDKADKITKSLSAFSNSDGGLIIYGVAEKEHAASEFSFVDGNKITTEHISQFARYVQPSIDELTVFPIRKDGDLSKSVYVVQVPKSDKAPHMAKDHRYYKRNGVESIPMEDFDVKDVMNRIHKPLLGIVGCFLNEMSNTLVNPDSTIFSFMAMISNDGRALSSDCKIVSCFFCIDDSFSPIYNPMFPSVSRAKTLVISDLYCTKISTPSMESIFPGEKTEIGHVEIKVPIDKRDTFLQKAFVVSTLYWEGGGREDMLYFCNGNKPLFEKEEIAKHIPEHLLQYILG